MLRFLVTWVVFASTATLGVSIESQQTPLTLDQVVSLVDLKVPDQTIAIELWKRGFAFTVDDAKVMLLRSHGVGVKTFSALTEISRLRGEKEKCEQIHTTVSAMAFSPAADMFAAGDGCGHIYLWELSTGFLRHIYNTHYKSLQALQFAPSGYQLLTAGTEGTVHLLDLQTNADTLILSPDQNLSGEFGEGAFLPLHIESMGFTVDGQFLLLATTDRLMTWRLRSTESLLIRIDRLQARATRSFGERTAVGYPLTGTTSEIRGRSTASIVVNPENSVAVIPIGDTVLLWDLQKHEARMSLDHESPVAAMALSTRNDLLLTLTKPIVVKDAESRRIFSDVDPLANIDQITKRAMEMMEHNRQLQAAGTASQIIFWHIKTGDVMNRYVIPKSWGTLAFAVAGGGNLIGLTDYSTIILLSEEGEVIGNQVGPSLCFPHMLVFSSMGDLLAADCDDKIVIWNLSLDGGEEVVNNVGTGGLDDLNTVTSTTDRLSLLFRSFMMNRARVSAVASSVNGQMAVAAKDIRLYDPSSGRVIAEASRRGSEVTDLLFSNDGKRLAAADRGGQIAVWKLKNGDLAERVSMKSGAGAEDTVKIDASVLNKQDHLQVKPNRLAFSPDDNLIAYASDRGITIWNSETGSITALLVPKQPALSVTFLDHDTLATGLRSGKIELWSILQHKVVGDLRGHQADVFGLLQDYTSALISADVDGEVKCWDVHKKKAKWEARNWELAAIIIAPDRKAVGFMKGSEFADVAILPVDELHKANFDWHQSLDLRWEHLRGSASPGAFLQGDRVLAVGIQRSVVFLKSSY